MLKDLIVKNRSTCKYYQDITVSREILLELVDVARLSPSGGNRQLLKYYVSCEPEKNIIIYNQIGLEGNPPDGKRPSACIIILNDLGTHRPLEVDHGIAAQSILLGATEQELGGCMVGIVNRKELQIELNIPARYEILLVLAIGKPKEKFVFEPWEINSENARGWWDEQGVRHIPKCELGDIIVN